MFIENTNFDGIKTVRYFRTYDDRGVFIKPWLTSYLQEEFGLIAEAYFSYSEKGVIRGLHYQSGVTAQKKYVVCISGCIEDIALDMRPEKPTYGQVFRMKINSNDGIGVIIPEGFAHAVFAHENSTIVNFCNKPYCPGDEGGVIWSSLEELKDLNVTIVSEKDINLPPRSEIFL